MAKKILCPIDFSECSTAALKEASARAKQNGARLYLLHVDSSSKHPFPGNNNYVAELDEYRKLLTDAVPTESDVEFEQHYMVGDAVAEILRFAILRDIDLIVMGTHGRGGLAKMLLGSVAEGITQGSKCEVVTVKA